MKLLETVEELKDWEQYREFLRDSLKLLDGEGPAYISKDKIDFSIDGKPWRGHAFVAGKKAIYSVKKFKKDGEIFREGLVRRKSKELHLSGFKIPKLMKESQKTFLKLKLGYKVYLPSGEEEGAESGSDSAGLDGALREYTRARTQAFARLQKVGKVLIAAKDPDAREGLALLKEIQKKIPARLGSMREVEALERYLKTDAVVKDLESADSYKEVKLSKPLLKALDPLKEALGS